VSKTPESDSDSSVDVQKLFQKPGKKIEKKAAEVESKAPKVEKKVENKAPKQKVEAKSTSNVMKPVQNQVNKRKIEEKKGNKRVSDTEQPIKKPKQDSTIKQPSQQPGKMVKQSYPQYNQPASEIDGNILAEQKRREDDRDNRTIYLALHGKLGKVSDSAVMALHPDIISANRIGHAAFLVFSSQAVRDKAYPAIEKAQLKNKPVQVDCCGSKSKKPKKSAKEPSKSLIFLKTINHFQLDTTCVNWSSRICQRKPTKECLRPSFRTQMMFTTFVKSNEILF
jgi:hypothetical protein